MFHNFLHYSQNMVWFHDLKLEKVTTFAQFQLIFFSKSYLRIYLSPNSNYFKLMFWLTYVLALIWTLYILFLTKYYSNYIILNIQLTISTCILKTCIMLTNCPHKLFQMDSSLLRNGVSCCMQIPSSGGIPPKSFACDSHTSSTYFLMSNWFFLFAHVIHDEM